MGVNRAGGSLWDCWSTDASGSAGLRPGLATIAAVLFG